MKIYNADCLQKLDELEADSIDSIVTDPPYELNFMGKGWDNAGVSFKPDTWEKCLRVLKPGGYLLAFGGSRTYHRIACAIEDAGFEIRDTIMWLYGSGFPKSMDISKMLDKKEGNEREIIGHTNNAGIAKYAPPDTTGSHIWTGNLRSNKAIGNLAKQWQGWGTALKPAFEPIIVARKPFKGSCIDNVLKYGVGVINIDECRVPFNNDKWNTQKSGKSSRAYQSEETTTAGGVCTANDLGRFPANVILTYDETDFVEVCSGFPYTKGDNRKSKPTYDKSIWGNAKSVESNSLYSDSGSASRYFYCAKANKKDRNEGLELFEKNTTNDGRHKSIDNPFQRGKTMRNNTHPTVKPTELMQYLIRLVTPRGGYILDPFMGSGSTGKAVMYENKERNAGYKFIGIEKELEYYKIAEARITYEEEKCKQKSTSQMRLWN